jgi:hypothetical protein
VNPRAGLDDVEKGKNFLTLPGLGLRTLCSVLHPLTLETHIFSAEYVHMTSSNRQFARAGAGVSGMTLHRMSQLLVGRKQFAYESLTSSVVAELADSTPLIPKAVGHGSRAV